MRRSTVNSLSSVPEGENSESDHSQDEDEDEINAFAKHLGMDPHVDVVQYHYFPPVSPFFLERHAIVKFVIINSSAPAC